MTSTSTLGRPAEEMRVLRMPASGFDDVRTRTQPMRSPPTTALHCRSAECRSPPPTIHDTDTAAEHTPKTLNNAHEWTTSRWFRHKPVSGQTYSVTTAPAMPHGITGSLRMCLVRTIYTQQCHAITFYCCSVLPQYGNTALRRTSTLAQRPIEDAGVCSRTGVLILIIYWYLK